ncbi:hypothetical protein [Streptomyces sp. AJS327]|uniref:hypothetical protein n=1 Tax=Streptomyces sp. AJS327 TaxID=2545265 RepID=UPI0015DED040|nr:hypothetical protein [Streptomyces sp. AJS327]
MSLPAADELFRTTGGSSVQPSGIQQNQANGEASASVPPPARSPETGGDPGTARDSADGGEPRAGGHAPEDDEFPAARPDTAGGPETAEPAEHPAPARRGRIAAEQATGGRRSPSAQPGARAQAKSRQGGGDSPRARRATQRRPSGRERHDEKITVYVSAEELMDLEHARLVLRGEHGLAVDRGRIVREAVAVVLADLESRGEASILVRRLRGR